MNNLLPSIKSSITHRADDKNVSWRPADAHPKTGRISSFLESEFTKETTIKTIYGQNILPSLPPNEKHVEKSLFPTEESPLQSALRELADRPRISFAPPPSLTRKTVLKDLSNGNCLLLKMINTLPISMDLFVQKKSTISNTTVHPMRQLIAGMEDDKVQEDQSCFWYCTVRRAVMSATNRQELREYTFSTRSQIGLEVEAVDDKLVVTQVLPDCQATRFEVQLKGADVIAVNGIRVINMAEFREAMVTAKAAQADIVLKVASYKGGKGKMDTLYSHDFSKSKEVKSLLSNIMMHGLDSEHHRGIMSADTSVAEGDEGEESENETADPAEADKANLGTNIRIDGWENLEQYPDIEVVHELDQAIQDGEDDEQGMRAQKRAPLARGDSPPGQASRQSTRPNTSGTAEDDGDDASSVASGDSWNKLTKVEEIVTRRSIVCFPGDFATPPEWGVPRKCLQVSNYSTHWHLEVAWINEDHILVRKGDVPPGNTDYQLADVGQVWCVIARQVVREHGHHAAHLNFFGPPESSELATAVAAEEGSPAMLVIRPSRYAMSNSKCTSVLWSPYVSMSITQRLYMAKKEEAGATAPSHHVSNFSLTPQMHIQIFDGVNKSGGDQGGTARTKIDEDVQIDRVKLSKWPRKSNAKREKALKALRKQY